MSAKSSSRAPLIFGIWFTASITVGGLGYATFKPKPSQSMVPPTASPAQLAKLGHCQTVVTDPQPPLNIRSSPVVAPDNVVGHANNGTALAVVGDSQGWLKINAPVKGWVYQELTATHCNAGDMAQQVLQPEGTPIAPPASGIGGEKLAQAREAFHSGNLAAAIDHLKAIPAQDPAHAQAQALIRTMPAQWQQAATFYTAAQKALAAQQPQAVFAAMKQVPDIRYWRSRMAPIVQAAIQQNQNLTAKR
jgi:Bacterial SH3 domain